MKSCLKTPVHILQSAFTTLGTLILFSTFAQMGIALGLIAPVLLIVLQPCYKTNM